MAAVGLMCRLLSDSVSSLLLSLTPKLYPELYFIMIKLNQWWWWDVNLIMHSKPHMQGLHLRNLTNCTTITYRLFHLQFSLLCCFIHKRLMIVGFTFNYSLYILLELCVIMYLALCLIITAWPDCENMITQVLKFIYVRMYVKLCSIVKSILHYE